MFQVLLLIIVGTEKSESNHYSHPSYHVVAMEKEARLHILTKCSKCNTFQVISNLVHDFMNFNALQFFKIHEKKNF